MKAKEIIVTMVITFIIMALYIINFGANKYILKAQNIYGVYLNGDIIGYIADDKELYSIINKRQREIKLKYNVEQVYPPENFKIINTNSYNVEISSAESIYERMLELSTFLVEGYSIKIKDDDGKLLNTINVLDKNVFDNAINSFILAFVDEEKYNQYITNTQPEIETVGMNIDLMYFQEHIFIKQGFISVKEKIFTDEVELSQYLLFGDNNKIDNYVVKSGDTVTSISDDHQLNVQEFLIANPRFSSVDSMLTIGDKVNITLINPLLSFAYEVSEVADEKIAFEKKVVYDLSKDASYNEITTPGVTGVTRISSTYKVVNGEKQAGVIITASEDIVTKVDQVTTKGGYYWTSGEYVDTNTDWGWPTNTPYVITSRMGWRWGTIHNGIDISGTGYGSPIYSVADGTVASAGVEGMCGSGAGYCVCISHPNGYYTFYAHMVPGSIRVKTGDRVSRGDIIGGMGQSGYALGTHLHFSVWYGIPYRGTLVDPLKLY